MVDKIDRPNPPEPWVITSTARSQDRGQRQETPPQEHDDEYSSPGSPNQRWQKFHGESEVRRIVNIDRHDIRHLWFRKAVIQRQTALVECDMEMLSGEFYRSAQFLLPRLDDYFQFKGYIFGQEVPATVVTHDPIVEVSVLVSRPSPTATPPPMTPQRPATAPQRPATQWWSLWDAETQQLQPFAMVAYGIVALLIVTLILILV